MTYRSRSLARLILCPPPWVAEVCASVEEHSGIGRAALTERPESNRPPVRTGHTEARSPGNYGTRSGAITPRITGYWRNVSVGSPEDTSRNSIDFAVTLI